MLRGKKVLNFYILKNVLNFRPAHVTEHGCWITGCLSERRKLFMVLSLGRIATEAAMGSVGELWDEPQPMDPEAACGFYICLNNDQSLICSELDI